MSQYQFSEITTSTVHVWR